MRLWLGLACLLAVAGCRAEPSRHPASGLEIVDLDLRAGGTTHRFRVEVARNEEEQARGMMFRETLGPDEGMLFPFAPPRPASFWMKDTPAPLDMIFIRPDGTIARIEAEAVPYSLESVEVAEPLAAVLEIAGGRAAALGIAEDAKASWPDGPPL